MVKRNGSCTQEPLRLVVRLVSYVEQTLVHEFIHA